MRICGWLAALVIPAACSGGNPLVAGGEDEWRNNYDHWRALNLRDYSFRFQPVCFCIDTEPVIVEVRTGQVFRVTYAASGQEVPPDRVSRAYRVTVDSLFGIVRTGFERGAASLRAQYDPDRGNPTEVFIDYVANAADEEYGFQAQVLTP